MVSKFRSGLYWWSCGALGSFKLRQIAQVYLLLCHYLSFVLSPFCSQIQAPEHAEAAEVQI